MKDVCRAERRNKKIVALSELKNLHKTELQSVSDFCVELERLTRKAYPELDEQALSVIRADQLYEQLMQWDESCQLQEVLEGESIDVYERLKEAAMRVERRRISQLSRASDRGKALYQDRRKSRVGREEASKVEKRDVPAAPLVKNDQTVGTHELKCFNCGELGHKAKQCGKPKPSNFRKEPGEGTRASLSTKVRSICRLWSS